MGIVLAVLGCAGSPALPPPDPLDIERRVLRSAEQAVLLGEARAALDAGEDARAARVIGWGLPLAPEAFRRLSDEVVARGDPTALALLAGSVPEEVAARARRELEVRTIEMRFGPDLASMQQERAGVDLASGRAVLAGIEASYIVAPDHRAMTQAANQRLADLWASPAVRAAFPLTERAEAKSVLAAIEGAIEAGLPEPIAVAEVIEGALAALDPYTRPVWPAGAVAWEEHHAGAYTGVGVELEDDAAGVVVSGLTEGGTAFDANVHVGDRVLAVDGVPAVRAVDATERLRGQPGTEVVLEAERGTFRLKRKEIRPPTVAGWRRGPHNGWIVTDDGVALVRIAAFRPKTDEELDALVADDHPAIVVLDLRGNAGGDVMAAVNVADRFVADGELAHLVGRTVPPPARGEAGELPWNVAVPGHALEGVPLVVLVDRETASAAELLAGALRERAGAVLVGERTFGKGLSQALESDPKEGVSWQVTQSAWTLPSGARLEAVGGVRQGLAPDVEVALSTAERFQVKGMRAEREALRVHQDSSPVPSRAVGVRSDLPRLSADPQLVVALRIARQRGGSAALSSAESSTNRTP